MLLILVPGLPARVADEYKSSSVVLPRAFPFGIVPFSFRCKKEFDHQFQSNDCNLLTQKFRNMRNNVSLPVDYIQLNTYCLTS